MDATLYAMFVQSTAFDLYVIQVLFNKKSIFSLLERSARKSDIPQYKELIRLLSTEIVYPLRR